MQVKNIIFDLGGVLFDIDYHRTSKAFIDLGLENFDEIYSKQKQNKLFDEFEKGNISSEAFRNEVRKHLPSTVTSDQIDDAWNAMLIGIPQHRYAWLDEIANKYEIFLCSNTNIIHVDAFSKMIESNFGIRKFENIFRKVYYSCELGMRKPDAEIFELIIAENSLDRTSTLFIDDSIQHVEGARKVGLEAIHLVNGETIEGLLVKSLDSKFKK